ncbi:hypothetical protein Dimus_029800 [Dionaea muscipula]
MEPLPVNCGLKMNHPHQQRPHIDHIEPHTILSQISSAKLGKGDAYFTSYRQPSDTILAPIPNSEYSEISIFDANKYFSCLQDQKADGSITPKQSSLSSVPRLSYLSSMEDGYGRNYRTRSFHATPMASSESSCWNSQTGLLSNPPGSAAVSIKSIPSLGDKNTKSSKWFHRHKCPCSGKKSVEVKDANSEYKIQQKAAQFNRSKSGGSSFYSNTNNSSSSAAYAAKGTISSAPNQNHCTGTFTLRPQLDHQSKIVQQIQNPNLNGFSSSLYRATSQSQIVRAFADRNGNATVTTTSNSFTFPVLNSYASPARRMFNVISPPLTTAAAVAGVVDDIARDSLEVFQPQEPPQSGCGKEINCHFTIPSSPRSRKTSFDEEIGSDASSDLFEIESFSTQTTSYPRRDSMDSGRRLVIARGNDGADHRRSLDELMNPSVAPSECYAPSEASVVWSVTTAEAFDRDSLTNFSVPAASDVEYGGRKSERADGGGQIDDAGGGKRRGNVGLLSCRSENAVSVGRGPVKHEIDPARIGPGPTVPQNSRHVEGRAQTSPSVAQLSSSMATVDAGARLNQNFDRQKRMAAVSMRDAADEGGEDLPKWWVVVEDLVWP